jgi:enoyl-CoA hydratase/carnithine racemase
MTDRPAANGNERVLVEVRDHVGYVTLNRPDKRNALDLAMFEGLAAAAGSLADAEDLRAVVLAGRGPAFCAGLDLQSLMSGPAEVGRLIRKRGGKLFNLAQQVAWAWRELPVPVVAALQGETFGGGLQIALGADFRLVAPDARLSIMEIRWGLIPDMASSRILKDLLRLDVSKELAMTGRIVGAEEAVALGLGTRLCADPVAEAAVLAGDIAARSPDAVRATKFLFNRAPALDDAMGLELERRLQLVLVGQPNQVEAVRAGMAGEAPSFRPGTVDPGHVLATAVAELTATFDYD